MGLSCAMYDQLELSSMRGEKLKLLFCLPKDEDEDEAEDEVIEISTKIKNLYVKEGKEYLLTDGDQEYPLDCLVTINEVK